MRVTCHIRYEIDPFKVREFEHYAKLWIPLVKRYGGTHHGYFLPSEGASDIAYALFTFESLKAYEEYRIASANDDECLDAFSYAEKTRCVVRYERSFLRPVFN